MTTRSALGEGGFGGRRVARFPLVDQVAGLAFLLVADERRAVPQRLLGRGDSGKDLVVDVDQLERVLGDVPVRGDHGRHLLALVADLVGGQHGLCVA